VSKGKFDHPYPTTKILWMPDKAGRLSDTIATTGDYLRLWDVGDSGVNLKAVLNNVRLFFWEGTRIVVIDFFDWLCAE
jgi:WD repeat-containing protein 68